MVAGLVVLFVVAPHARGAIPTGADGPGLAVVLERLERDASGARKQLVVAQRPLIRAARAQQVAAAAATRGARAARRLDEAASRLDVLDGVVGPAVDAYVAALDHRVATAERRVDDATVRARAANGDVLDAQRRIEALTRAVDSEDVVDPDLGSYRFGAGGPAVSAASLDAYLESKASPMSGSGADVLAAGLEHEIDPRLIVAIAGAESYFGLVTCAPFNAWGWGCPSGPYRFTSWGHGAEAVARGLRTGYVDSGRTTVPEIHAKYAPLAAANDPTGLNAAWSRNVARFLVEQGGDPMHVAGLAAAPR